MPEQTVKAPTLEYGNNETVTGKLWKKTKNEPFVPLGLLGMISALGYGFYKYKHRGNMSTSVYLMHLRVQAQSMVVGAMTVGVAYTLFRDYWKKNHGNGDGNGNGKH